MRQSDIKQNHSEVKHEGYVAPIEKRPPKITPLEKNNVLDYRICKKFWTLLLAAKIFYEGLRRLALKHPWKFDCLKVDALILLITTTVLLIFLIFILSKQIVLFLALILEPFVLTLRCLCLDCDFAKALHVLRVWWLVVWIWYIIFSDFWRLGKILVQKVFIKIGRMECKVLLILTVPP